MNADEAAQRLHELLCAYLLGETSAEESAEIERALAESPELRAEREHLEATIHCVKGAFPEGETLAEGTAERLLARAATRRRPWYASTAFRMAASIMVLTLGYTAIRSMDRQSAPAHEDSREDSQEDSVAMLESPAADEDFGDFDTAARVPKKTRDQDPNVRKTLADGPAQQPGSAGLSGFKREEVAPSAEEELLGALLDDTSPGREQRQRFGKVVDFEEGDPALAERALEQLQRGEGSLMRQEANGNLPSESMTPAPDTQQAQGVFVQNFDVEVGGDTGGSDDSNIRYSYDALGGQQGKPEARVDLDPFDPYDPKSVHSVLGISGGDKEDLGVTIDLRAGGAKPVTGSDEHFLGQPENTVSGPSGGPSGPRSPGASAPGTPGPPPPLQDLLGLPNTNSSTPGSSAGASTSTTRAGTPGAGGGGHYRGAGDTLPPGQRAPVPELAAATPPLAATPPPASAAEPPPSERSRRLSHHSKRKSLGAKGELEKEVKLRDVEREVSLGFELDGRGWDGDPCTIRGRYRHLGPLTLDRRHKLIDTECRRLLDCCRPYKHETPSAMYFRFWGDNPYELAAFDRLSTFSVDVDTASYALARRYLKEGHVPTRAQIRTEEFVNYFKPDLAAPLESDFALYTELAPSRFGGGADRWMLRVGLRGREISREERQPLCLSFVIDTSGSMKENNRLELVKHALRLLIGELDARDAISLVAFSNEARLVLPMTSVANRGVIESAIHGLTPNGGTNAEAGLWMGYEMSLQHIDANTHNRVVLLSDGVANIGQTDQGRVNERVRRHREQGIFLNTVGVGMGNHNDVFLEQLANNGDGIYNYIDDEKEARRALVENFTGAFEPIARDVKIQVDFDPQSVYRYRLLGYENRAVADKDFRNDAVDAGEVGAGHQVVALYELELTSRKPEAALGNVHVRWLPPSRRIIGGVHESAATEISQAIDFSKATGFEGASAGYRRSVVVAQLAELLRRSSHARNDSLDDLLSECARLERELGDPDFTEFAALVARSRELIISQLPAYDDLSRALDEVRLNHYLRAQLERLQTGQNADRIQELEQKNDTLEALIRDIIRQQVEQEAR